MVLEGEYYCLNVQNRCIKSWYFYFYYYILLSPTSFLIGNFLHKKIEKLWNFMFLKEVSYFLPRLTGLQENCVKL